MSPLFAKNIHDIKKKSIHVHFDSPGAVARSVAMSLGVQAVPVSIPESDTFFVKIWS